MPFAPHLRMTALGRFASTDERFSYGVNFDLPGVVPSSVAGTLIDFFLRENKPQFTDMANDTAAFHGRVATHLSNLAILQTVKFAAIGADGKYLGDPFVVDVPDTPGAEAGDFRLFVPPQVALVVSLQTARRGPGGKGRIYLPTPVLTLDAATMTVQLPVLESVRGSVATWINALNNAPGVDVLNLDACVSSTKGYNTRVDSVKLGRALDTMRSRRRALLEAYTASSPIT